MRDSQARYVDPEKALEAKERGNEQFRAGQWAKAIQEYEEVRLGSGVIKFLITFDYEMLGSCIMRSTAVSVGSF